MMNPNDIVPVSLSAGPACGTDVMIPVSAQMFAVRIRVCEMVYDTALYRRTSISSATYDHTEYAKGGERINICAL